MTHMPKSDADLEAIYDLVNRQPNEARRQEVVRIALLAAQHRAAQLQQKGKTTNGKSG